MSSLRKWHKQAVACFAAASVLLGGGSAHAQTYGDVQDHEAGTPPSDEDFVLLQLQIKKFRMQNDLRGYRTQGGVCVDMADMIQALDLAVRLDKKSRRATGWLFSEDRKFTIDRDANAVQIVNDSRKLQPGEIIDTPEGWCVDTRSLAGWLDIELKPNLYESVLVLNSEEPLPFMQALERKSRAARLRPDRDRRDLSAYPQAPQPYRMWSLPSVDVIARASYRESGGRGRLTQRYEIFASGEAARVSYDMRLASDSNGMPETLRVRGFRKDPDGKMLGPLKATHIAAGDVEMLSGNLAGGGGVGRGAFISNRALERPTRFGTTVLRGTLPLGWDAEFYRNGQLLAYQNGAADGRYEFEVNLVYGQNDLEVVLYGPQGQVRRERQSVPVGFGAMPPGKFEYWAGIIQRNRDLIDFGRPPAASRLLESGWQYAAGVQYGVDRRTVAGVSGHSLFLDGRRREYAEVNLQRSVGSMLLNLTAAQEFGRGRAYRTDILGKFGKLNVQLESFYIDGGYTSGLVSENERSAHRLQFDTLFKIGRVPVPVSGGVRRSTQRDGRKVNEMLARASLIMPGLALTGFVLHRDTVNGQSREDGVRAGLLANTRIGGIGIRGEGTYRLSGPRKGFDTASVTFERPIDDESELRLEIEHSARFKQTDFELGYVRHFRHFAMRGGARIGSHGTLGANVAISFSLGRDPLGGGVRFSREKLAQRGHAAISVFLDEDGDGHRSADEVALEGVGITAGQRWADAPTDENGHAFVEGLAPYQKVLISVDESTLPDPFLMPIGKGVVITPRPGVPAVLEIAVAPTGEVEGVINGPEGTPLAGVELELVGREGQVAARTMSEYDGFFLFDRVAYGTYKLRLTEKSAAALGMVRALRSDINLRHGHTLERVGIVRVNLPTYIAGSRPSATVPEQTSIDGLVADDVAGLRSPPLVDRHAYHHDPAIAEDMAGASSALISAPGSDRIQKGILVSQQVVLADAEADDRSALGQPVRPLIRRIIARRASGTVPVSPASPVFTPAIVVVPEKPASIGAHEVGITDEAPAILSRDGLAIPASVSSAPDSVIAERVFPISVPFALPAACLALACILLLWIRRRARLLLRRNRRRDE